MKKKNNKVLTIITAILITIVYLLSNNISPSEARIEDNIKEDVVVHFLDVGQADSIFLEFNNKTMLIDAGTNDTKEFIYNYITKEGYNKIDYLVATHPHADHIGGMSYIVKNLEIDKIYMPKVTTNTKVFENLLTEIDNKKLKIKTSKAGLNILDEGDLKIDIIAPIKDKYEELNNYSTCIKLTYKDISYLFMGDAEKLVEDEINMDIQADILKLGHHGSSSSTSKSFLKKVNPKYAIISVGEDNSYNHPHKETLTKLKDNNIKVYRTDKSGTIKVSTDGKNIKIDEYK